VRLVSVRRGKKGEAQQAMFDALIPVVEKHCKSNPGTATNDQFWGMLDSSIGEIRRIIAARRMGR